MELSEEKRSQLKKIVIICLLAFLFVYGIFMYLKYTKASGSTENRSANGSIVFTQPTLQIFDYKDTLNLYPDRVLMHYPYFIVVKPESWKSDIYNIETKSKEKSLPQIALDYYKGNTVYNKQGYETYYNNKSLKVLCDQAFIKSSAEILCISRPDVNSVNNELILINIQTLKKGIVYKSENVLTALYFDKDNLYIGEYNFEAQKAYLVVNGERISALDLINTIYPINGKIYLASFKSKRNNLKETYAVYSMRKKAIDGMGKGKIVFSD